MNNIDTSKWYFSTWFIIVMFICFWPAGIALLILKNTGKKNTLFIGTTDKRKYVLGGVALVVIGLTPPTFTYKEAADDFGYNPSSFKEGLKNEIGEYLRKKDEKNSNCGNSN